MATSTDMSRDRRSTAGWWAAWATAFAISLLPPIVHRWKDIDGIIELHRSELTGLLPADFLILRGLDTCSYWILGALLMLSASGIFRPRIRNASIVAGVLLSAVFSSIYAACCLMVLSMHSVDLTRFVDRKEAPDRAVTEDESIPPRPCDQLRRGTQSTEAQKPNPDLPLEASMPSFPVLESPDGEPYFPKGRESYYTSYYRGANLPSILTRREPKGHIRFRLAILPSFTKPLFLTYSRGDDGATIEIARLSLRKVGNGMEIGPVELSGKVTIGEQVAKQLEADALAADIRLPLRKYTEEQLQLLKPLDGCTWILEVSTDHDYTMADVSNPEWMGRPDPKMVEELHLPDVDTSGFIEFCQKLLNETDLRLPENGLPEN